jgi:hypothetical protein
VSKQFSLPPLSPEDFPKTGQELCALSKSQLLELAGPRAGSVLAAHLANLKHSVTGRSPSPLGDIRLDIDHSEAPTGKALFNLSCQTTRTKRKRALCKLKFSHSNKIVKKTEIITIITWLNTSQNYILWANGCSYCNFSVVYSYTLKMKVSYNVQKWNLI